MEDKETIILSLGGSLIVPNGGINTQFLKEFEKFVRKKVAEGRRFFIVCGGGQIARHYRDAGAEVIGKVTPDDLDWLAIHCTRLNAHLLRTIFRDIAHPRVIDRYDRKLAVSEPVVIAAGWKPGWSTDYCATLLTEMYKVKTVINMSNIEMVYDKDPRKFKDARPIEKTSWEYFRTLVGDRWIPGMNAPFDPIASKLASELKLTVIVLKGDDLENLEKVFKGKKFVGTVIAPVSLDASFYDREYFEGGVCYKGYTTSIRRQIVNTLSNFYRALCIRLFLNPKKLLDVGCATGKMVKYLRLLGVDAYGLEISKYALSKAGPEVKPYLKYGDILAIPYGENSFDVVTTFNVLEHVETDKLSLALSEGNRVSKKICLYKIHTRENWWMNKMYGHDFSSVSVFSISWWLDFFKKQGYTLAKKCFFRLPVVIETIFLLDKK